MAGVSLRIAGNGISANAHALPGSENAGHVPCTRKIGSRCAATINVLAAGLAIQVATADRLADRRATRPRRRANVAAAVARVVAAGTVESTGAVGGTRVSANALNCARCYIAGNAGAAVARTPAHLANRRTSAPVHRWADGGIAFRTASACRRV